MSIPGRRGLLSVLLCLPLAVLAATPAAKPAAPAPAPVAAADEASEYALWSALITHGLGADAGQVVIADTTTTDTSGVAPPGSKIEAQAKKLDVSAELLAAWVAANEKSMHLARHFKLKVGYELLDDKQRAALFKTADPVAGWASFRDRFPKAPGLLRLSRAAFDADQQHAIAYIEYTCGPACGSGRLIRAQRKGQGWQVLSGELIWIAGP